MQLRRTGGSGRLPVVVVLLRQQECLCEAALVLASHGGRGVGRGGGGDGEAGDKFQHLL